jgi:glycosyltransferase involved in cell wall biosynthesis
MSNLKKVYCHAPGESWIVDRMTSEFNQFNADMSSSLHECDVVWLLADWAANQIESFLWLNNRRNSVTPKKPVVATVHHIVPEKWTSEARYQFKQRDVYIDVYHVFNHIALEQVRSLTSKPIVFLPYWCNPLIWKQTASKEELRTKHNIPQNAFVCGSFVRDTEGAGISRGVFLPKLEKGPDLLVDFLKKKKHSLIDQKLHVVLAGWRRQYVIQELQDNDIDYTYVELPSQEIVNELYQTLDLYPVTARHEGGPQSLLECGLVKVPVVSRNIGIASQVLPKSAINDDVFDAIPFVPNVVSMTAPKAFEPYRKFFNSL